MRNFMIFICSPETCELLIKWMTIIWKKYFFFFANWNQYRDIYCKNLLKQELKQKLKKYMI